MSLHLTRREMIAASILMATITPAFSQEKRSIKDVFGTVEIPADAKRIVVTDGDDVLQPTVALGIKPVGASRPSFTGGFAKGVGERLPSDIGYIGSSQEPNFEAVLALEPDLIIMSNDDIPDLKGMYDRYSQIAPTVLIDVKPPEWQATLKTIAAVAGRESEATDLLGQYQERVKAVRQSLGDKPGTATIARVRTNLIRYMLQDTSFTWSVLKDVGFTAPAQQDKTGNDGFINISLERLDLLEADYILLLEDTGAMGPGAMTEKVKALPTFASLKGKKIELPSADYLFGNVLTAFNLLDQLEAQFRS